MPLERSLPAQPTGETLMLVLVAMVATTLLVMAAGRLLARLVEKDREG